MENEARIDTAEAGAGVGLANERQILEGRTVLVRTAGDPRNPAIALRGSLRVVAEPMFSDRPRVTLVVNYPDMFTLPGNFQKATELWQESSSLPDAASIAGNVVTTSVSDRNAAVIRLE